MNKLGRRKYLLIILGLMTIFCVRDTLLIAQEKEFAKETTESVLLNQGLDLLKRREDQKALVIFEEILLSQADNLDALWGKAEVLRRRRNYQEAENLLNKILDKNPRHLSSLNSLAYIKYKKRKFNAASLLTKEVLKNSRLDRENSALAFLLLGSINSKRASEGWLFSKIKYGTRIKSYFLKAKKLAPDLPEVHLGLGTFYLLAPAIIGGDLDKATEELEAAVKIAPRFATANARLAQLYKRKGLKDKYKFYLGRASELDPENEVLQELKEGMEVD